MALPTSLVAQTVNNLPAIQENLGQEDPLEKKMATHSSILAWKIPWTEEPGRFTVHGVARIGHDLATKPPPPRFFTEVTTRKDRKAETCNLKKCIL